MMMSGTSLSAGSFFSLLQTEKPFIRGSSIDSRIEVGPVARRPAAARRCRRRRPMVVQPSLPSSFGARPRRRRSLSNTRTLVAWAERPTIPRRRSVNAAQFAASESAGAFSGRRAARSPERFSRPARASTRLSTRDVAPAHVASEADEQVVERRRPLRSTTRSSLSARERAGQLVRLFADLRADAAGPAVVEALRVARLARRRSCALRARASSAPRSVCGALAVLLRARPLRSSSPEEAARRAGVARRPVRLAPSR